MSKSKLIDLISLTNFKNKIISLIPTKVSQLKNDSGYKTTDTTYGIVSKTANGLVPQLPNETTTNKYLRQDGTWATPPNTTYGVMTGATASAIGKAGLVPAPATGKQNAFLRGDGTWVTLSTSLAGTVQGIPLDSTVAKILKDQMDSMKQSFQDGVDALYNKCVGCGATPGARNPAAISTSIQKIYDDRYSAGVSAGQSGKNNVWKSGTITAHKGNTSGRVYFSIAGFPNYKNITIDNIFIELINIMSGSGATSGTITYTYNNTTGEILAQCSSFYGSAQSVYQNFKAKIVIIY